MLNNSKLFRSGCTPRVIFYSQTSKGHEYNYGKPILSITGRNSRHITPKFSEERKLVDYIKPHPQPNSKRTLIPNCENIDINSYKRKIERSKLNHGNMDNTFLEIKEKKQKSSIKISKKNNNNSFEFLNSFKEEEKIINDLNENKYKKYNMRNKYDYNSEILNLQGGIKKKANEIIDDYQNNRPKKININPTALCFKERNINSSEVLYISSNLKNRSKRANSSTQVNRIYRNNDKLKDFSNELYSSNNIISKNNYNRKGINNILKNDKKNIINNYHRDMEYINDISNIKDNSNNCRDNINTCQFNSFKDRNTYKRKEETNTKGRRNIYNNKGNFIYDYHNKTEINDLNNDKKIFIYKPINNNSLIPNYFDNIHKGNNNYLEIKKTKRKNMESYNKIFNKVHQEENKYSLMNYHGKYYSKKNYSQIELH